MNQVFFVVVCGHSSSKNPIFISIAVNFPPTRLLFGSSFSDIWTCMISTPLKTLRQTQTHTCPRVAVDLPKLNHGLAGSNDAVGVT